jgi:hypothetical protein
LGPTALADVERALRWTLDLPESSAPTP